MFKKLLLAGLILRASLFVQTSVAEETQFNTVRGQINLFAKSGVAKKQRANIAVFIDRIADQDMHETHNHADHNGDEDPLISQRGRRFRPGVLTVEKGETVDFMNDDRVLHNVFSLSSISPFDLGNYKRGTSRSVTFEESGLARVYCNLHSKMVLNILVLENSFHTTTNNNGEFELKNIPDGQYQLRVWQEFSEEQRLDVVLSGGEIKNLSVDLHENKSFVQHRNKYGKPYRGKY